MQLLIREVMKLPLSFMRAGFLKGLWKRCQGWGSVDCLGLVHVKELKRIQEGMRDHDQQVTTNQARPHL